MSALATADEWRAAVRPWRCALPSAGVRGLATGAMGLPGGGTQLKRLAPWSNVGKSEVVRKYPVFLSRVIEAF